MEIDLGTSLEGRFLGYVRESDDIFHYTGRIYVPLLDGLHTLSLYEAHPTPYLAHPSVKKMYANL